MTPSAATVPAISPPPPGTRDGVAVLHSVDWEQFEALERAFPDRHGIKLTYWKRRGEIMSPISKAHEDKKSILSLLLETYLRSVAIRFYRTGGYTLQHPGLASNEPDESYCLNRNHERPDLVIEIEIEIEIDLTSGTLDKRQAYFSLATPELWVWQRDRLHLYALVGDAYESVARSRLLPELDIDLLADAACLPDQYDAVRRFEAALDGPTLDTASRVVTDHH